MKGKVFPYLCFTLALAEIVAVVGSWVLGVLLPDSGLRSMLDSDGIRWFFGSFTSFVSGEALAWIVLLSMAWSSAKASLRATPHAGYSLDDRVAIACAIVAFVLCMAAMLLLTAVPHAALLSVEGSLFPSPFSRSLVAVVAFVVIFTSIVYGVMSGRYHSLRDLFLPMKNGVEKSAWLIVTYIFAAQLIYTLLYIVS